ncbi:autotransporter-associated beta strand repeat-containing protein [Brucella anthropi]|uniref:autotransporter-associated beta strand repeat-containing protein n=1 Tax=Brucella anthropi TaxID=529 RepID=UPI000774EAA3|nr:autotransporter-associated beta strand repeat-containing protein [Brucella anthropi]KXO75887.1 hypothetical protein AYJ56_10520 [Brucella anthropi]
MTIKGGKGGKGGMLTGGAATTPIGGGGGGGAGAIVTGSGASLLNAAGATIIGGEGGGGGINYNGSGIVGGGGTGGDGVVVNDYASFTNQGSIVGGAGAASTENDNGGFGGSGLRLGTGTHVVNAGSIASGTSEHANGQGDAVDIVGNDNIFEIWFGSSISGNVVVAQNTSGNILGWGGDTDSTFDVSTIGNQYRGFQGYRKSGKSTWTLTGAGTFEGGITIADGTLSVGSNGSLGAATNALTLTGGTLLLTGSLDNNRNVHLTGAGTIDTSGYDSTFSGVFDGTGRLTKAGAGTLTLSGANTFTGGATISGGILQIGAGGVTGSITGNITNNGALVFNRTGTLDFTGTISGTGGVQKLGAGTLTLTGTSSYTGGTEISGGILQIGAGGVSGSIAGDVTNDGKLVFNRSDIYTFGDKISGTGSVQQMGGGTLTLSGTNSYTGGTEISGGILSVNSDDNLGKASGGLTFNGGTLQLGGAFNSARLVHLMGAGTINTNGHSGTFSGGFDGTGKLTKVGAGTLTLSGTNGYTGGTEISGGILSVSSDGNLGNASGGLTFNGGTLQLGGAFNSTRLVHLTGAGTINTNGNNAAFSGIFDGTGKLTKAGNGTLTLSHANTYTGGTEISGGILSVSTDGNLGDASGDLTFDGGTLQLDSAFNSARLVHLTGAGTIDTHGNNAAFSGIFDGTGKLTKAGDGTLTLSGQNTYSGGTDITGGVLSISADDNLGNGGAVLIDNGTLQLTAGMASSRGVTLGTNGGTIETAAATSSTFSGVMDGTGLFTKTGDGTLILTGTNTYNGGTTVSGGTLQIGNGTATGSIIGNVTVDTGAALAFNRSGPITYSDLVSGTGSLRQDGAGTLILTGANTYTGGTTISSGTLQIGDGSGSGSIQGNVANNGTLAFNRSNALDFSGVISGSGTINQLGAGSLTLSGDSSAFTGMTNVNAGELVVSGKLGNNTSTLQVASGASLAGSGTIGGNTTIADGATLIGAANQMLNFNGNLSLGATSVVSVTYGSNARPFFNVQGDLALGGQINVTDFGGNSAGVYRVFSYGGALSGTISVGSLPAGVNPGEVSVQTTANAVNLINAHGATLNFWDGDNGHDNSQLDGGDGTWNAVNDNWTGADYSLNGPWATGGFAIFGGAKGTVTVDDSKGAAVSAAGMQFMTDGYEITGDALTLAPSAESPDDMPSIRVGDGSLDDESKKATISAELQGSDGMNKTGLGTLILTGNNSYTGGTFVTGGTLQLGDGGSSGGVQGEINLGSTASSAGTLAIKRSGTVEVANEITGTGHVEILGIGTVDLTGSNSYLSGTLIKDGSTLIVSEDDNLGVIGNGVELESGSTLRFKTAFDSDHNYVMADGGGKIEAAGTNTNKITTAITGSGSLTKVGTGTLVLAGDSNYAGGTIVSDGTLQIGDGNNKGRVDGAITNNGIVAFNRSDDVAMSNVISGTGSVKQVGSGVLTLSGNNTYLGGTTVSAGVLKVATDGNLGNAAGALTIDGGSFGNTGAIATGRSVTVTANGGTVQTDADLTLTGAFDASAATNGWHKKGASDLIFDTSATGDVGSAAIDAGTVTVKGSMNGDYAINSGGILNVSGTQNGNVNVNDGGMLTGSGIVDRNVTVADNGILQGASGTTLTINGNLDLNANSQMNVSLGMSNQTALFDVHGNLTLAGTLNITDAGGFGAGYYHLISYQGNLTDNTLVIGGTPAGTDPSRIWVDTSVDHQVNLASATGVRLNIWDGGDPASKNNGRIDGGDGDWDAANFNWTDNQEKVNGKYDQGSFAVFMGKAGTVRIDDSKGSISAAGLQFATDGYRLTGAALNLDNADQPIIRVGDGSAAGKAIAATIEVELQGSKGINKTDYGTLILTGANHYTGGTTVTGGVLQIGSGGTAGSIDGNVNLTGDAYGRGTLAFDRSDLVTFAGNISGVGNVVQKGDGTTTFTGDNSYAGGLTVEKGKAQAGVAGHAFGTGTLKVKAGARADLNGFDTTVGGLAAFDASGAAGDGDITLGSGKLTVEQGFDSRFSGVISGTGDFAKTGSGVLTLSTASTYTGATAIDGGSLKQGASGVFNASSSGYTVGANGTLDLGGFDTTLASLSNAGLITSGVDTAGTTLTVAGNYAGNGGTVVINTVLGDDSSKTDRLKVGGDTSGTTNLKVVNRGGIGGQTVNGIEVVDVAGQSNGTFSLVSDYTTKDGQKAVVGGAYAYTLQQGPAKGNKDGNWYLTSQLTNPTNPVDPNNPGNPRYSAGVPVYQGYAENMQALNKLPTLQERVGDRYWTGRNGNGQTNGAMVDNRGIWARIEGAHNRLEPQSVTGAKQDINTFIMQAGVDGQFYEDENGRLIAGITGQYGTAHARSSALSGDGTTSTNAWSLGATATWYGNNGFYVDAQGQMSWFDNDLNSDTANAGLANDTKAYGYAMSVEAGQRVAIDEHWSLTPQAQLMWSSLDADAFHDIWGSRVHMQNGDSLVGRLGLAASYADSFTGSDGLLANTSVYGVANLYQSFLGGMRINVAGVDIDTDNDRTWAGIGAGGTYSWADNKYAVYGEGSINTSLNHFADSYALKGTVGFKVKW